MAALLAQGASPGNKQMSIDGPLIRLVNWHRDSSRHTRVPGIQKIAKSSKGTRVCLRLNHCETRTRPSFRPPPERGAKANTTKGRLNRPFGVLGTANLFAEQLGGIAMNSA